MSKYLILFIALFPILGYGQFTVSGRILNQADTKPLANASVFLSNTTIGAKTSADGKFELTGVMPGKYTLVVSTVGFETHNQSITITGADVTSADVLMFPKTMALKEVAIRYHKGNNRSKYYEWFKSEFLGNSTRAKECEILNPDVLDFSYDEAADKLTASTYGSLEIKNEALGYKIKYEITNFSLENRDKDEKKVYYEGPVQFEQLKGTKNEMLQWKRNRQNVYENSPLHFLRSALSNNLTGEGFSVQQYAIYANPERPADTLINRKISYYQNINHKGEKQKDSLAWWMKKARLKKTFQSLMPYQLSRKEIINATSEPGQYALGCENDGLLVIWHKSQHYRLDDELSLDNPEATLISFNSPEAYFNRDGSITNPYSVIFYGAWGNARVAELLPTDYDPPQTPAKQKDNLLLNQVMAKLDTFKKTHLREKAYLHLDKPYYAAGDTIYFKAYVTMGEEHLPSTLSSVLHVDLMNTQNKVDQSLNLQLTDGMAWGDFSLPDTLPKGNYTMRAYTRWMLNDGSYFNRAITIGTLNSKVSESGSQPPAPTRGMPDIQFLPEGGALVAGLNTKIAFKALNTDGLAITAKGTIVDNDNQQVGQFESSHLGMGAFSFIPREGKTYRAGVRFANGLTNTILLPVAIAKGVILSVNNDSIPKAEVKIAANETYYLENRDKNFLLVIKSGDVVNAVPFSLDSQVMKFDILKRRLRTGIASVTLLSPSGEPLCERLLFVQNYDRLNLDVSSDKSDYKKRGKVSIKLNASTRADAPVEGHFSVSVIDEGKVPDNGHYAVNILTNLLLTADLKGNVEQPAYYFDDTSIEAAKNLDLLMLTQGYRGYSLRQMLQNNSPAKYQPETGLAINGIVKNLLGKPIANGEVTLVPVKGGPLVTAISDANGMFKFEGLDFTDTTRYVLSAVNSKGKNSTQITYLADKQNPELITDKPKHQQVFADTTMLAYMNNYRLQQNENVKYGRANGIMLKTVNIKAKAAAKPNTHNNLVSPQFADQLILPEQLAKGGPFSTRIEGVLHGAQILRLSPQEGGGSYAFLLSDHVKPMLVIVDGTIGDGNLDELTGMEIEYIEVLKSPGTVGAYSSFDAPRLPPYNFAFDGILVINTALNKVDVASIGILPIRPKGYYKAREFYAPKYEYNSPAIAGGDLRSTIFWKPELVTGKDGIATFDFYNADGTGTYKVVIEGIDSKGNLGRQVYRYKVE